MENSYWNGNGKHQELLKQFESKSPIIGYTHNVNMNLFITTSNLYYDYFNNGGGNVADVYMEHYERNIKPYLPEFDIDAFMYGPDEMVERAMDETLQYLEGKSMDYQVHTVWLDFEKNSFSREKPIDNEDSKWRVITFGTKERMLEWCKNRIASYDGRDITNDHIAVNDDFIPDYCFSVNSLTGDLIYIKKGFEGYYEMNWSADTPEKNKELAAYLNEKAGVNENQVKAMEFGSMFGWDKPGAKPSVYAKPTLTDKITAAESKLSNPNEVSDCQRHTDIEH